MRKIKFRAWDTEREKMAHVSYIGLNDCEVGMEDEECRCWNAPYPYVCRLMQYTGLKDKNGKEIYEGDIVITKEGYIGLIELGTYDTDIGFNVKWITDYLRRDLGYWLSKIEVIGNIYENPELLGGSENE